MAKVSDMLVKPQVKYAFFKNASAEKATYLDISKDCLRNISVEEDIRRGGVQFQGIGQLLEKKKLSRIIALSVDSMEMGLMAVTYLALALEQRRTELSFDSDAVFGMDEKSWNETAHHIPIISENDIFSFLHEDDMPFESGGFLLGQQSVKDNTKPYWCNCRREAVCITMTQNMVDEVCLEALHMFEQNRQVYVLFIDSPTETIENEIELPFGTLSLEQFHAIRNNFILSNAADEAVVSFENADDKPYYRNVLKQNLKQRDIRVKRGFSYERIINLAGAIRKKEICQMIDKIINYAVKDLEEVRGITLENRDFSFIDHFVRPEVKSVQGLSGRQLLEKELVGMEEIKQQVYDVVNVMKYNKIRKEMQIGGSTFHNVHVMLGAPGTAKTTVAKYMGKMMFDEKLLPDNRFICINGAELKGMYVGHSAPKTKALFEKYDVIIIDEAYSIVESNGTTDSFGNEAIAQLIIELEKHSTDKLVIFAGYGGEDVSDKDNRMHAFLDANPGIKSRITSTFYFKSYTPEQMLRIFERIARNGNYGLENGWEELVQRFFTQRARQRDFGNGREARVLLETAVVYAAKRTMESGKTSFTQKEMTLLTKEDIRQAAEKLLSGFGSRRTGQRRIGFTC